VVAASPMARARVGKAVQNGFELNEAKIQTASVIVFCSRMNLSAEHMDDVAGHEHSDGRFPNAETDGRWRELVKGGLAAHEFGFQDLPHWIEKQTYLALGIALMAAAALHVDALPMEGFRHDILDEELDLNERGYTSTVLLALGRQSEDDYIRRTPNLPPARGPAVYRPGVTEARCQFGPASVHLPDPFPAPGRGRERLGEILRLVHHLAVAEFHEADRVDRLAP
jgi:nitroreductase/dihydropteridine reductase